MEKALTITLHSLQDNEAAFDRYKLRPRVLINVEKVDTETEILGTKVSELLPSIKLVKTLTPGEPNYRYPFLLV